MSDDIRVDPVDVRWGRMPGARPPLRPWHPISFSVLLALVLIVVVILVVRPAGELDQPDLAYQRDGLLRTGPALPPQMAGVDFGDGQVVLLFVRELPDPDRLTSWLNGIPNTVTTYVVVQSVDVPATAPDAEIRVIEDPDGQLADAADLPSPKDGGPGIGYAVVDSRGLVRYSTLDRRWYDNSFEVATIVRAVP